MINKLDLDFSEVYFIQRYRDQSVGPDAKLYMFNNFDLDKPFDLHLNPPSAEDPPLCRIIQEGKDPILNVEPKP